jgi:DNA-binding Lrp family transcriptional regulator
VQYEAGLTLHELAERIGADPEELRRILREEVDAGHVDYFTSTRRYAMNGGLDDETRLALRDLRL